MGANEGRREEEGRTKGQRGESKGPVSQLANAKDYISRQCTSILKG